MADPSVDPNMFGKAIEWVVAVIGTLLATCWGFLKNDINRAHDANTKALQHIQDIYEKAEIDREKNRDRFDKVMETQNVQYKEIVRLIQEGGRRK